MVKGRLGQETTVAVEASAAGLHLGGAWSASVGLVQGEPRKAKYAEASVSDDKGAAMWPKSLRR